MGETKKKKSSGGFLSFIGNLFLVIMSGLFFGMVSLLLAGYVIPHHYQSETQLLLQKKDGSSIQENGFANLIASDAFLNQLITDTRVGLNCEQLRKRIQVSSEESPDTYKIQVTADDPYVARAMVLAIRTRALEQAESALGGIQTKVLREPEVPGQMSFPNYFIFGIGGIIAGMLFCILILAVAGPRENVIITSGDVEYFLEMKCIGEIPVSRVLGQKSGKRGK